MIKILYKLIKNGSNIYNIPFNKIDLCVFSIICLHVYLFIYGLYIYSYTKKIVFAKYNFCPVTFQNVIKIDLFLTDMFE